MLKIKGFFTPRYSFIVWDEWVCGIVPVCPPVSDLSNVRLTTELHYSNLLNAVALQFSWKE